MFLTRHTSPSSVVSNASPFCVKAMSVGRIARFHGFSSGKGSWRIAMGLALFAGSGLATLNSPGNGGTDGRNSGIGFGASAPTISLPERRMRMMHSSLDGGISRVAPLSRSSLRRKLDVASISMFRNAPSTKVRLAFLPSIS